MSKGHETTIRWSIWGLAITGAFFAVAALVRGQIISPIHPLVVDQHAFAQWVAAPGFLVGNLLMAIALMPDLLGVAALYVVLADTRVGRLTLIGALLTFVGDMLYGPYLGAHAFAWPQVGELYLQGMKGVYHVVDEGYNTPAATVVGILSSLGYTAGSIVLGVAISRSRRFASWAGPAFAVHGPLLGIPVMPLALEVLGGLLLLASGVAVARTVSRELDQRTTAAAA
jgi:hypothetical protein